MFSLKCDRLYHKTHVEITLNVRDADKSGLFCGVSLISFVDLKCMFLFGRPAWQVAL
jgi:hypothetical protein